MVHFHQHDLISSLIFDGQNGTQFPQEEIGIDGSLSARPREPSIKKPSMKLALFW
jgi:hypothetical protein